MIAEARNLKNGQYIFEVVDYINSSFESVGKTLLAEFEDWKINNPKIIVKSVISLPGDAILVTTTKSSS